MDGVGSCCYWMHAWNMNLIYSDTSLVQWMGSVVVVIWLYAWIMHLINSYGTLVLWMRSVLVVRFQIEIPCYVAR